MKIISGQILPTRSETDCTDGVCASGPPAIVVRDGRECLADTGLSLRAIAAALARGDDLGLSAAQLALVEAAWERDPAIAEPPCG